MPKLPTAPPANAAAVTATGSHTRVESIYPQLYPYAEHTAEQDGGSNYRLTEIRTLQRRLEDERDERAKLYKKYRRVINVIDGVDTVLVASILGMGAAGVGLLSTVIAAPVVVALEAAAVACGQYCWKVRLSACPSERRETR